MNRRDAESRRRIEDMGSIYGSEASILFEIFPLRLGVSAVVFSSFIDEAL
jgi:hypothetical protein